MTKTIDTDWYRHDIVFNASEEQEETGLIYKEIEKFEKELNRRLKKERTEAKKKK